jgi:hypothetical protein
MLTLEKIFEKQIRTNIIKREILFEDGLWCIYKRTPADINSTHSLIHRCSIYVWSATLKTLPVRCPECEEAAPEGILGLLELQQWGTKDGKYAN